MFFQLKLKEINCKPELIFEDIYEYGFFAW